MWRSNASAYLTLIEGTIRIGNYSNNGFNSVQISGTDRRWALLTPQTAQCQVLTETLLHSSISLTLKSLLQLPAYQPVINSEKNVWAFWDTGFSNCLAWCQRNVISWVRRLPPSWTVHILDNVEGSPAHISKFISPSFFPEALTQDKLANPQPGAHTSDLVRLPLLSLYGGVWHDVSPLLFWSLDSLCWNQLADPAHPFEMASFRIAFSPERTAVFNGFIAARRSNPCIKLWHAVCLEVWRSRTTTVGMHKHPLLQHLPRYEAPSIPGAKTPIHVRAICQLRDANHLSRAFAAPSGSSE
ncbi:MAG: hypothetical protein Q9225_001247 [Loekoesia sp. 1 TL-2023]